MAVITKFSKKMIPKFNMAFICNESITEILKNILVHDNFISLKF